MLKSRISLKLLFLPALSLVMFSASASEVTKKRACLLLLEPSENSERLLLQEELKKRSVDVHLNLTKWREAYSKSVEAKNFEEANNQVLNVLAIFTRHFDYFLENTPQGLFSDALKILIDAKSEEAIFTYDPKLRMNLQLGLSLLKDLASARVRSTDPTQARPKPSHKKDAKSLENTLTAALSYTRPIRAMAIGNSFRALVEPNLGRLRAELNDDRSRATYNYFNDLNIRVSENLLNLASADLKVREQSVYFLSELEKYMPKLLDPNSANTVIQNANSLEELFDATYVNGSSEWDGTHQQGDFLILPKNGPYSVFRVRAENQVAGLGKKDANIQKNFENLQRFTEPFQLREVIWPLAKLYQGLTSEQSEVLGPHILHTLLIYRRTLLDKAAALPFENRARALIRKLLEELTKIDDLIYPKETPKTESKTE